MNWFSRLLSSSIGKKMIMALTGLFLITFLIIHCTINAMIFLNDGGETFLHWGHFMSTNPLIRILEIGLVAGFLIHIFQGIMLIKKNRDSRPVRYQVVSPSPKSTWYSRSMGLLGTFLLLFLIMHTAHFWIPNRSHQFTTGEELNLYQMMLNIFANPLIVALYVIGCISLAWHLMHGFWSAFQTLGFNHQRYNLIIHFIGTVFAIVVPLLFALMPIAIYFKWVY